MTAGDMAVPANDATVTEELPTYAFESRFEPGVSSVSYGGQTLRHVLVEDLNGFIGQLGELVDGASGDFDEPAEITSALRFFYEFDESGESEAIRFATDPAALQRIYGDLASGRSLAAKVAGKDGRDHEDWADGAFAGWSDSTVGGGESPAALIDALFDALAENAFLRAEGEQPNGPDGEALPVYVTADGLDLQQMIQKFLLMAVHFSQGTDDYLDEGIEGANAQAEGQPYTGLEHAWDEAFGYFGAARDYDRYADEEIAGAGGRDDWQGVHDSDGDGSIDLTAEVNFGASINAGKRDVGAASDLDLTGDAFDAFVAGRAILAAASDELTSEERAALEGHRDQAALAWERAIGATVIHYINEVLADMDAKEAGEGYLFVDHAKHFSELKGFALGLQFNPRSPVDEATFESFHDLVGDRPVLALDSFEAYRAKLLDARALLADAYAFDGADVDAF